MNFLSNFWDNFGVMTLLPLSYPLVSIHSFSYPWIIHQFTRRIFGLDAQEFMLAFIIGSIPMYTAMIISTCTHGLLPKKKGNINWYHFVITFVLFMSSRYMCTDRRYYKYLIF